MKPESLLITILTKDCFFALNGSCPEAPSKPEKGFALGCSAMRHALCAVLISDPL
jgi:hypothetical protein